MNLVAQYIVFDPEKSPKPWLKLSGPACYPEWQCSGEKATRMTFSRAHQFANAYGSKQVVVVGIDRMHDDSALMAAAHDAASRQLLVESPWSVFG